MADSVHEMTDEELKARACLMWRNWIETGNVCLSKADAFAQGMPMMRRQLDADQVALCERLERLGR